MIGSTYRRTQALLVPPNVVPYIRFARSFVASSNTRTSQGSRLSTQTRDVEFAGQNFKVFQKLPKKYPFDVPEQLPSPTSGNVLQSIETQMIEKYDKDGSRQKLMQKIKSGLRVGAVVIIDSFLSLKDKSHLHQFAGFVTDIKRRGIDTRITLRNRVAKTAVEMQFPVFSPLIRSLRVLSPRGLKKVRRARLNYIRKQDKGDVSAWVDAERIYYERLRQAKRK